jgi:hypothetical protein
VSVKFDQVASSRHVEQYVSVMSDLDCRHVFIAKSAILFPHPCEQMLVEFPSHVQVGVHLHSVHPFRLT